MSIERKRKPKTVKPFVFTNDENLIKGHRLDLAIGQGAQVLSVLRTRPGIWNSRELGQELAKLPDWRSKMAPETVANWWICKFKRLGVIRDVER